MKETSTDAVKTWDDRAATWEDQAESHTYAEQAFTNLQPVVNRYLGGWENLRVLDFGSGTGLLAAKLAPVCREIVALDVSPKMIQVLDAKVVRQGWRNVVTLAGELGELLRTRSELHDPFDLIVASSVCSFLPDFPSELGRLRSMLRTDGIFVQWDWHANVAGDWASGFTREQLKTAYAGADLTLLSADIGFLFTFDGKQMEVLQGVGQR